MHLDKAIEILDLNVRQRDPKMPPDVLDALKLGREGLTFLGLLRAAHGILHIPLLNGETE